MAHGGGPVMKAPKRSHMGRIFTRGKRRHIIKAHLSSLVWSLRRSTPIPAEEIPAQLIFTVTNGRSGSNTLYQLFNCISCVEAHHESRPSYHLLLRNVQHREILAEAFLRSIKVPHIQETDKQFYFDASHFFCKGYLEPALKIGLRPSLVILRRDRRKIALSLFRLQTIPGRTKKGLKFYLSPDSATLTELPGHEDLSDYQMCFWHVLEIEARQDHYPGLIEEHGGTVVETSVEQLNDEGEFERILWDLGIPITDADKKRIEEVRGAYFNTKSDKRRSEDIDAGSLDEQEQEVLARIRLSRL